MSHSRRLEFITNGLEVTEFNRGFVWAEENALEGSSEPFSGEGVLKGCGRESELEAQASVEAAISDESRSDEMASNLLVRGDLGGTFFAEKES